MKFIDNLTNWYVRTNRKRLKGEGVTRNDTKAALDTLFMVVYTLVRYGQQHITPTLFYQSFVQAFYVLFQIMEGGVLNI